MARAPIMTALLGVPAHPADRAAYDEALLGERGGHAGVCEHCQATLDRISDRAVGLMTADSIFAALALYLSEKPGLGLIGALAMIQLVLAVGLLCTCLWLFAPRATPERTSREAVAAHGLNLVRTRTIRFTLSLWLSGLAYLFILAQVTLSLVWS
ncbi:MAG: hypothetical protein K1X35_05055 [Caulobacteraceae bacterium]|nr:hypothetical protein [Caulobacteraceae bacterium]